MTDEAMVAVEVEAGGGGGGGPPPGGHSESSIGPESFVVDKLTSSAFTAVNPPMDWCDSSFLIPHEALRREMQAMLKSVEALDPKAPGDELWKARNFCDWYINSFHVNINTHHHTEEAIYFPWVKTRCAAQDFPEKTSKAHEALVEELDAIKKICEMVSSGNVPASEVEGGVPGAITQLKEKIPVFVQNMSEHLQEEETSFPPILRQCFTREEEQEIVNVILKEGGLTQARLFLPSIILAMKEWASEEFQAAFNSAIPPPIAHLLNNYYLPDQLSYWAPLRDSPTLEMEPELRRVPCCKCFFCCHCCL